jgi:hypothetical protein
MVRHLKEVSQAHMSLDERSDVSVILTNQADGEAVEQYERSAFEVRSIFCNKPFHKDLLTAALQTKGNFWLTSTHTIRP